MYNNYEKIGKILCLLLIFITLISLLTFNVKPTTVTHDDISASFVAPGQTYVVVLNFTITTKNDSVLNGTAPNIGKVLENSNQSDWGFIGGMCYYDDALGNSYDSGVDCIFLDDRDSDGQFDDNETVLNGTAPANNTPATGYGCMSPSWNLVKSYDFSDGGEYDTDKDAIILEGSDNNTCYFDELNSASFKLAAGCNATNTDISELTLWVEDALLGAANYVSATSSWNVTGLTQELDDTPKTFYAVINISSSASNGRTIRFQIPASGLSYAGTNQSELITNSDAKTIDASDPVSWVNPISGYWKDTSPLTITAYATDTVSGIDSVTLYWSYRSDNSSSWGGPVSNGSVSSSPYSWKFAFENGSGHYRFYSIATDNASNVEDFTVYDAICGYDVDPPDTEVSSISGYWKDASDKPLAITTETATDAGSGIYSVTLYWYKRSDNSSTWEGPWSNGSVSSSPYSWKFAFENGSGHYRFFTNSTDLNGNVESNPTSNDTICGYDVTAPESEVIDIAYTQDDSPITLNANANDTHSGVDSVTLYWYNSSDNSTWNGPFSKGADSSSPYSWSFSFDNGSGYYRFYTIATDELSNEELPTTNDTACNFTNEPPTADAGGPYTGYIDENITFDGSDSADSDGTLVGYRWDFDNDGEYDTDWDTSATVEHNYTSSGNYTIKLQVKDDNGSLDTDTATVTITEEELLPPIATAWAPVSALQYETFEVDCWATDNDGYIVNFTWTMGDGTTKYGKKVAHSYSEAGNYIITIKLTDDDGLTGTNSTSIEIIADTDADGWSDDLEESYNTDPEDADSYPLDTDSDGTPDEDSDDGEYDGDLDDDNDGLLDTKEEQLGTDPKNASDVKSLKIKGITHFLLDTNLDGKFDKVYNTSSTSVLPYNVKYLTNGSYLIDTDGDGRYDHIYNPVDGAINTYTPPPKKESEGFPLLYIVIIVVVVVIMILFLLLRSGLFYFEYPPEEYDQQQMYQQQPTDQVEYMRQTEEQSPYDEFPQEPEYYDQGQNQEYYEEQQPNQEYYYEEQPTQEEYYEDQQPHDEEYYEEGQPNQEYYEEQQNEEYYDEQQPEGSKKKRKYYQDEDENY